MRILRIFILASLVIFPFGELLRFDIGNNIVIKPLDAFAGLTLLTWLVLYFTKQIKIVRGAWVYFLFPLIGLISLVVNSFWLHPDQLFASSLYLIRWVSYAGMFFAVMQMDEKFKKKIAMLLLLDGLLIVVLGFIQYSFFQSLIPLYHLGWDDHMYRLFSVFLDPNYTGAILVLYLLFTGGLLYSFITNKKPYASNIFLTRSLIITKKILVVTLSAILVLTLLALFLTFSRSSLLMFIISASVFFILIGRKKLIFLMFGIIFVFILLISSKFYVENINLFRQASTNARIGNLQVALDIVKDQPILGVGFNTYRYAKDRYNIVSGWTGAPSHADAGVDNSFLFVFVTTGIIGLVSYLFLWWNILRLAFARYKNDKNIYAVIVISSSIGLFIHALFINSLFFPAILFWMWIVIGLMGKK